MSDVEKSVRRNLARFPETMKRLAASEREDAAWLAGYAAAREQAARLCDAGGPTADADSMACGELASAIRAMEPEKPNE